MNLTSRILAAGVFLLLTSAVRAADGRVPREKAFDQHVKPFLKQYCVRFHNAEKMKSGIRVDHLQAALGDPQLRLWENLRKQIGEAAMPPEDEAQPTAAQRRTKAV